MGFKTNKIRTYLEFVFYKIVISHQLFHCGKYRAEIKTIFNQLGYLTDLSLVNIAFVCRNSGEGTRRELLSLEES